jgi:hypothetical protein
MSRLVQQVAPDGFVPGDAVMQHEVVIPTGNSDRIEFNRSEPQEDFEYRIGAAGS